LERVVDGTNSDNLTAVIKDAIITSGGVEEAPLPMRFASFGAGKFTVLHVYYSLTFFLHAYMLYHVCIN